MTTKVKITDGRYIGEGEPCFIIAEAGSNHNGDIETAKKLIDAAAAAKADACKFQIFKAETLYSKNTPEFSHSPGKNTYDLIKTLEMPRAWIKELSAYCGKKGIMFMATPFDFEAVDLLDPYVSAYKIASFEIVDLELIRYMAEKKKPIIFSEGMATLGEVEDAIGAIRSAGNEDMVLLHCTSMYPSPPEIVNLRVMKTLKKAFDIPVGLSDHTQDINVSCAAVALGACVVEKHFTLSRKMVGPDHPFAIEPDGLARMVSAIREVESAMGDGVKRVSEAERAENYRARRSIHAKTPIPRGTKITRDMLIVKRPGFGILPRNMDNVIGRVARKDIEAEEWITWDMI